MPIKTIILLCVATLLATTLMVWTYVPGCSDDNRDVSGPTIGGAMLVFGCDRDSVTTPPPKPRQRKIAIIRE